MVRGRCNDVSREPYPATIIPPETPDTRAQLYILLKVSKLHRTKEGNLTP